MGQETQIWNARAWDPRISHLWIANYDWTWAGFSAWFLPVKACLAWYPPFTWITMDLIAFLRKLTACQLKDMWRPMYFYTPFCLWFCPLEFWFILWLSWWKTWKKSRMNSKGKYSGMWWCCVALISWFTCQWLYWRLSFFQRFYSKWKNIVIFRENVVAFISHFFPFSKLFLSFFCLFLFYSAFFSVFCFLFFF